MDTPAKSSAGRFPPGRLRELGPINWTIAKVGARTIQAPQMHLFTTLGQHRLLFWAWAFYGGRLLSGGRLPAIDTELVILRVARLRDSEYELQHHRKLARRRGLDDETQAMIFAWPVSTGLTDRQCTLLRATDDLVTNRAISEAVWQQLTSHLDRRQLIELCLLTGHYDALATTIAALQIPLDFPR